VLEEELLLFSNHYVIVLSGIYNARDTLCRIPFPKTGDCATHSIAACLENTGIRGIAFVAMCLP
jgi:hypothetical protein